MLSTIVILSKAKNLILANRQYFQCRPPSSGFKNWSFYDGVSYKSRYQEGSHSQ